MSADYRVRCTSIGNNGLCKDALDRLDRLGYIERISFADPSIVPIIGGISDINFFLPPTGNTFKYTPAPALVAGKVVVEPGTYLIEITVNYTLTLSDPLGTRFDSKVGMGTNFGAAGSDMVSSNITFGSAGIVAVTGVLTTDTPLQVFPIATFQTPSLPAVYAYSARTIEIIRLG